MIDTKLVEAASERFLRINAGRKFCDSCLAINAGLTLLQATNAIAALGAFPDFAVQAAVCPSCSRIKPLICAKAA